MRRAARPTGPKGEIAPPHGFRRRRAARFSWDLVVALSDLQQVVSVAWAGAAVLVEFGVALHIAHIVGGACEVCHRGRHIRASVGCRQRPRHRVLARPDNSVSAAVSAVWCRCSGWQPNSVAPSCEHTRFGTGCVAHLVGTNRVEEGPASTMAQRRRDTFPTGLARGGPPMFGPVWPYSAGALADAVGGPPGDLVEHRHPLRMNPKRLSLVSAPAPGALVIRSLCPPLQPPRGRHGGQRRVGQERSAGGSSRSAHARCAETASCRSLHQMPSDGGDAQSDLRHDSLASASPLGAVVCLEAAALPSAFPFSGLHLVGSSSHTKNRWGSRVATRLRPQGVALSVRTNIKRSSSHAALSEAMCLVWPSRASGSPLVQGAGWCESQTQRCRSSQPRREMACIRAWSHPAHLPRSRRSSWISAAPRMSARCGRACRTMPVVASGPQRTRMTRTTRRMSRPRPV